MVSGFKQVRVSTVPAHDRAFVSAACYDQYVSWTDKRDRLGGREDTSRENGHLLKCN